LAVEVTVEELLSENWRSVEVGAVESKRRVFLNTPQQCRTPKTAASIREALFFPEGFTKGFTNSPVIISLRYVEVCT